MVRRWWQTSAARVAIAAALSGCAGVPRHGITEYHAPPLASPMSGSPLIVSTTEGGWTGAALTVVHQLDVTVHADDIQLSCDQYTLELPAPTAQVFDVGQCARGNTRLTVRDPRLLVDDSALVTRRYFFPPPIARPAGSSWRPPERPVEPRSLSCAAEVRPYLLGSDDTVTYLTPGRFELQPSTPVPSPASEYQFDEKGVRRLPIYVAFASAVDVASLRDHWRLTASSSDAKIAAAYQVVDRYDGSVVLSDRVVLTCDGTVAPAQVPIVVSSSNWPAYGQFNECTRDPCTLKAEPGDVRLFALRDVSSHTKSGTRHWVEEELWNISVPTSGAHVQQPDRRADLATAGILLLTFSVLPLGLGAGLEISPDTRIGADFVFATGAAMIVGGAVMYGLAVSSPYRTYRPKTTPLRARFAFGAAPIHDGIVTIGGLTL